MNNYDKILEMCACKDEARLSIQRPSIINGSIYSTNGHIMVRLDKSLVADQYEQVDGFPSKSAAKLFDESLVFDKQRHGRFAVDAAVAILGLFEKHDVYDFQICEKCDGDGYDGKGQECRACKGEGEVKTSEIIGKEFELNAQIGIGINAFHPRYIELLIEMARLQNETEIVMIAQSPESEERGTFYRIGKVDVLLMPMRTGWVECEHKIELKQ